MLPYADIIAAAGSSGASAADTLRRELPQIWVDAYAEMLPLRVTNIGVIQRSTFDFIYDDYATLEATGVVEPDPVTESRVVAVIGTSAASAASRGDSRLRGWVGPTEKTFGKEWDKGHFIAHSIGGAVIGSELNVYLQLRHVNRGWSAAGRRYRTMERYCASNPGVLCWNRPIYDDPSAKPLGVEFGILRTDGELWVEMFDNR